MTLLTLLTQVQILFLGFRRILIQLVLLKFLSHLVLQRHQDVSHVAPTIRLDVVLHEMQRLYNDQTQEVVDQLVVLQILALVRDPFQSSPDRSCRGVTVIAVHHAQHVFQDERAMVLHDLSHHGHDGLWGLCLLTERFFTFLVYDRRRLDAKTDTFPVTFMNSE